jgi:hypothetical protein
MTPQQPELRSGHPEDAGQRGPVPEANQPGHHPEREQDKPNPERVASKLRTRPWDQIHADESKALPKPLRTVAYGVGMAVGVGAKLAEEAWDVGGRLVRRVRGKA